MPSLAFLSAVRLGSAHLGAVSRFRAARAQKPAAPSHRNRTSVTMTSAVSVTVEEARELLFGDGGGKGKPGGFVYLDVRTSKEFHEQHVVDAVNIPVADMTPNGPQPLKGFVNDVNRAFPGKSQTCVVGCLSGARSEKAVALLVADGWPPTNLLDLQGGFRKYNNEFTPDGKPRAKPGVWKDNGPVTWTDS